MALFAVLANAAPANNRRDDDTFILRPYHPDNVMETLYFVGATSNGKFATNETVSTYSVPGVDCSIVHIETIFNFDAFNDETGRLRLDSLIHGQRVHVGKDGQVQYTMPYRDVPKYAIMGNRTLTPWHDEDGGPKARILKFDQKGFYSCDGELHADIAGAKRESDCFSVDLIAFDWFLIRPPYAYGDKTKVMMDPYALGDEEE